MGAERASLVTDVTQLRSSIRSEKLGEVAAEFDGVHSIERAVKVGSVDAVIRAAELRPQLIAAIERGPGSPWRGLWRFGLGCSFCTLPSSADSCEKESPKIPADGERDRWSP